MRIHQIAVSFLALALLAPGMARAQAPGALVLIEVNGVPITGADLDAMIMAAHQGGMSTEHAAGLVPKLLKKAVRDQLILQDAFAMGMADDPTITGPVEEKATRRAISLYTRSIVHLPEVSDDEKQEFFEAYYHKIQVRQISLSTEQECRAAIDRIRDGEITMGALALEVSLDPNKARGGLHNDKYWADVENEVRDATVDLSPGEFSEPFPYREVWSFVRVESRTPVNQDDFARFEDYITSVLMNQEYELIWADLVAEHEGRVDVQVNQVLLDGIRADEDDLYRGDFKIGSDQPVLAIDPGHFITDRQFRLAMSSIAMEMGTSTLEEILGASLADQKEELVLGWAADQAGWFESPEVVDYYDAELEKAVLATYLDEYISQKISVEREEFVKFYEEHEGEFRGAEEVRLSILTMSDQAVLDDAVKRLRDGADFDYLRAEIEGRDVDAVSGSPSWTAITVFSEAIVSAVNSMEVGDTSDPIPFGNSWLIFRLDGRREGSVKPIGEVESSIRQALYLREFGRLLDEHLAVLEEASVIVRHEDRIRTWAESES